MRATSTPMRKGIPPPPRPAAGFTLLEILVALAVLGLLMAGLVQGLRTGVAAWNNQTRVLAARGDVDATDRTIRTLIARMNPGGASGRPPILRATARSLTFTTTMPDAADALPSRVADVTLIVDDAHQLALLWAPHVRSLVTAAATATPPPTPEKVVLLRDVDRLEFAYWQDGQQGWQSEWRGVSLPKLIRVRILLPPALGRVIPDIVVSPMRNRWQL